MNAKALKSKVSSKTKPELSELASIIATRLQDISSWKSQQEVSDEVGFQNSNVLSITKNGRTKLALERVEPLAKALEIDVKTLMLPALRQYYSEDLIAAIRETFMDDLTKTEHEIIAIARKSMDTNENLSYETREAIREAFANNKPAGA